MPRPRSACRAIAGSLGAAAADFDADRHIDLFLTGVGHNRLLHNREGKAFEDISSTLKPAGPPAVSLMARWLDLDQDGDLDLYVVNYCPADHANKAFLESDDAPPGLANTAYRNDGEPDPASGNTVQAPNAGRHGLRQGARSQGIDPGAGALARRGRARSGGEGSHRDRAARHRQRS